MRPALLLALLIAPLAHAACPGTVWDSSLRRLTGAEESLCRHQGAVVLVVNTASQCGFTPQYEGLEALHRRYQAQGFTVIGVPSDQFGGQEFGDDAKIAEFCRVNFGVSFPMYTRSPVKGEAAIPLFRTLAEATGETPKWNFHKYLVGRDGQPIASFGSRVAPDAPELVRAVEQALKSPPPG